MTTATTATTKPLRDSVIALGDIHGRADLYFQFLDWVRDTNATVILLGDLIDRGPDDVAVLERTRALLEDPESWGLHAFYVLRGNHEQMFLDAIDNKDPYSLDLWADNGGAYRQVKELLPHAAWMRNLPYYITVGDTVYSHAGVPVGQDPATMMGTPKKREAFIWQRDPFLQVGPQFEKWTEVYKKSVFGHSPMTAMNGDPVPYAIPGGICIDTGAYFSGVLTAYNASTDTFQQFTDEVG